MLNIRHGSIVVPVSVNGESLYQAQKGYHENWRNFAISFGALIPNMVVIPKDITAFRFYFKPRFKPRQPVLSLVFDENCKVFN